jgi:hypothetical protein
MKTRAKIDKLILDWREDPCWELEETEGFEDHKDELLAIRMKCEAEWKARAEREHAEARAKLLRPFWNALPEKVRAVAGMPGTDANLVALAMAEMLLPLQEQINRLDARQESSERELDRQVDSLRKRIEALS